MFPGQIKAITGFATRLQFKNWTRFWILNRCPSFWCGKPSAIAEVGVVAISKRSASRAAQRQPSADHAVPASLIAYWGRHPNESYPFEQNLGFSDRQFSVSPKACKSLICFCPKLWEFIFTRLCADRGTATKYWIWRSRKKFSAISSGTLCRV